MSTKRLIDANLFKKKYCSWTAFGAILDEIVDEMPTESDIKDGEWSVIVDNSQPLFFKEQFRCSACGNTNTYGMSRFCPFCGAKMRGAKNERTD